MSDNIRKFTKDQLELLHKKLIANLIQRVDSGDATAAELNVARQMLKDNNFDLANIGEEDLEDLAKAYTDMPFDPSEVEDSDKIQH